MLRTLRHSSMSVEPLAIRSSRLKSVLPFFFLREFRLVWRSMTHQRDCAAVLLLQGRIEVGVVPAIAAKLLKMKLIGYVPFAHSAKLVSGRSLSGQIRDLINRAYYRTIGSFITCYEGAKADIKKWAPAAQVEVVHNFVRDQSQPADDRSRFRLDHGLNVSGFVVAMIGRIEFRQKGHDFVIENFDAIFAGITDPYLCIVGEGPDVARLEGMIKIRKLEARVRIIDWTPSVDVVLSSIDCLLLPSRFEGVPLVMLEALALNTPVVASRKDGMIDYLPNEWLFEVDDVVECNDCLKRLSKKSYHDPTDLKRVPYSQHAFEENFATAFNRLAISPQR